MSIKEELQNLRTVSKTIDTKIKQKEKLRRYYNSVKAIDYNRDKIKGGLKKDFTELVNKIIDLENEIISEIDKLCDMKRETGEKIKCLSGIDYCVIQMRYFEELKWEEICIRLNYSWRQIHYIHNNALKFLEKHCT